MLFNKKAVSLIISYVLLISIGLSISGLVYGWLRFYVDISEVEKCPEGIHIAISGAQYSDGGLVSGENLSLNLTIQNRGRFNVTGYVIRISNQSDIEMGIVPIFDNREFVNLNAGSIKEGVFPFAPSTEIQHEFNTSMIQAHRNICFIEVQPYIIKDGSLIPCVQVSTRKINCHPSA